MADFRHRFRDVDLLVIDDIHFLAGQGADPGRVLPHLQQPLPGPAQIILSSDACPPDEIPDLEDRLVSRFKWGLVARIDAPATKRASPSSRTRRGMRGVGIPDDVASFIATRIDSNIRELEGALTKVQMQARVDNAEKIDLAVARAALGAEPPETAPPVTIESVVDAVTSYYDVTLSHLQSKKRQRSIALPRQICMYLARQHTRYSLEEIGGYFGGRDHTTVLHAVRTVEKHRQTDHTIDGAVRKLETDLVRA